MFNPQYQSVLPVGPEGEVMQTQTAQLTDPIRDDFGAITPLLEQQRAQAIAAANAPTREPYDHGRQALALLMGTFGRDSMPGIMGGRYKGLVGGSSKSGGSSYSTSNPSTGRSSSAMGGRAY